MIKKWSCSHSFYVRSHYHLAAFAWGSHKNSFQEIRCLLSSLLLCVRHPVHMSYFQHCQHKRRICKMQRPDGGDIWDVMLYSLKIDATTFVETPLYILHNLTSLKTVFFKTFFLFFSSFVFLLLFPYFPSSSSPSSSSSSASSSFSSSSSISFPFIRYSFSLYIFRSCFCFICAIVGVSISLISWHIVLHRLSETSDPVIRMVDWNIAWENFETLESELSNCSITRRPRAYYFFESICQSYCIQRHE